MRTFFLKEKDIGRFYESIAKGFELYVPFKVSSGPKVKCEHPFDLPVGDYFFKRYRDIKPEEIAFNEYRTVEPIRSFFTYVKEDICAYFGQDKSKDNGRPAAILGVKNCDLFALKIQDFVFLGGNEEDPFYKSRRESALIISSDCPAFKEACFCRAFDINPHADEGFDINLSKIDDGYLVDIGSAKAEKAAEDFKGLLADAEPGQLQERRGKREYTIKKLEEHLSHHKIPGKERLKEIVVAGHNSKVWQEQMKTCVECGGCVFMCDTCHCFLLFDKPSGDNAKRIRIWDGCLYPNFTRVAGGANALKMRYMRLRNRYLKKFDFFIDNIGFQACCGCGRCIDVCPGKIDIRYILKRLYDEKYLQAE